MMLTDPLHAVRSVSPVTAPAAVAWFARCDLVCANAGAGQDVIGYLLAADRAEWFRCEGETARGPDGPRELAGAFELFATSGAGQLRWLQEDGGRGWAVCLSEAAAGLPDGQRLVAKPERRRLAGTAERLLAGRVTAARDGWATLTTARYAPCEVPAGAVAGQEVWAELAEYGVSDEHGNLSVIDTLLLSLSARASAEVPSSDGRGRQA